MILLLLAAGITLALGGAHSRRLNRHEILVAQTSTEMLERNEFLVPHISDRVRLKKPPLSYRLSIAAHRMPGEPGSTHVSEFEARLPSLISGLLIILVTYGIALQLTRDPRGGIQLDNRQRRVAGGLRLPLTGVIGRILGQAQGGRSGVLLANFFAAARKGTDAVARLCEHLAT